MVISHLYEELVERFAKEGATFSKTENGYSIEYKSEFENYVAKLLQDFYYYSGYNVVLLNQNGNCRLCLEVQTNNEISLLQDIKSSLGNYTDQMNYVTFMDKNVKATYDLFKKSLLYPGNFGIGVKNLAEVHY